ncbi:polysaccharide lyase family 7 protein [Pseudomonas borbori]
MIDLNHWNLTIPEQNPAQIIHTKVMKAGYRDKYFYRTNSGVVFWAPVTGSSTKGSEFPRSELRETFSDGKQRNWYYKDGAHSLHASLTVKRVPSSGRIVVGQIHSKDSSKPLLKILYHRVGGTGYVYTELRKKPGDADSPAVMTYTGMPLNQRFNYQIDVSKKGELRVEVSGLVHKTRINSAWAKKRLYFKAGVYTLDNRGPSKEGGRAEFHRLRVSHRQ